MNRRKALRFLFGAVVAPVAVSLPTPSAVASKTPGTVRLDLSGCAFGREEVRRLIEQLNAFTVQS